MFYLNTMNNLILTLGQIKVVVSIKTYRVYQDPLRCSYDEFKVNTNYEDSTVLTKYLLTFVLFCRLKIY